MEFSFFHASCSSQVGNGLSTLFWKDRWIDGKCIEDMAPSLYSLIRPKAILSRTVASSLAMAVWVSDIRGGLSLIAIGQFLRLWERLSLMPPLSQEGDSCVCCSSVQAPMAALKLHDPDCWHRRPLDAGVQDC
ncbi:hypothetical protein BRADI_3g07414v3 [Brachypodium distachyon]|uniref:Reverse transcriptase zinc-binding domain-containing protein n=1 Tax=Brachypodium distachyon TaxID=15368 RepID=A0A2K2CVR0_BRADI|nr:hypothetical protein BRADI_3g07414v3 [Brachypodium distachyon]